MKYLYLLVILLTGNILLAQNDIPREVTPEVILQIQKEVDLEVPTVKQKLVAQGFTKDEIEFAIDTFKIEKTATKRIEIDYSTAGMNMSISELTVGYDKLLNKYYNKLLKLLQSEDKKVLIKAQKAWLVYRDAENELMGTMTKDLYSGGGTIQSNIRAGSYYDLVSSRAIEIFNYYNGISKEDE